MARKNREDPIEKKLVRGPMDLPFLMLVLLLVAIGLVMLLSASYASAYYDAKHSGLDSAAREATSLFRTQLIRGLIGIAIMWILSRIDYQRWRGLAPFVLVISMVLLLMVHIPGLGKRVNGALRWLQLPLIPRFQPSEVAKFGVVVYFSTLLAKRKEPGRGPYNPRVRFGKTLNAMHETGFLELLPYGGVLFAMIGLLALQRHMSATILILVAGAAVMFVGGIKKRWFIVAGILMVGVLALIILTTDYMTARIVIWLDPFSDQMNKGYQAVQSLLAVGSGGLLGLGLGNGRQKFLYLPEEHNDFIFAIICEELGFVGAGIILILFALLIIRGFWLAIHARDRFGTLLVVGIMTLIAVQTFLNVAVVTSLIPTTGISLPFFSYGGTALMIQLAEMGVVLAVSRQIPAPKSE